MTVGLKDLIYILVYVISVVGLYFNNKNRLSNVERELKRGMRVLYQEAGKLNIIDTETCKRNRDEIFTAIRRSERALEMLLNKLEELNRNVLLISFKIGVISPDESKKDNED